MQIVSTPISNPIDNLHAMSNPMLFFQNVGFEIAVETICMQCLILCSGKNKKHMMNLSSAELAQSVGIVKQNLQAWAQ